MSPCARRCAAPPGTTHEEYIRYWIYILESASLLANQRGAATPEAGFLGSGYGSILKGTNLPTRRCGNPMLEPWSASWVSVLESASLPACQRGSLNPLATCSK